ncbi:hypothetical protein FBU30_008943 [Linnemannia zychae]|nr:hypothetical protein FBU30_008943 [Linnemannia zychae]
MQRKPSRLAKLIPRAPVKSCPLTRMRTIEHKLQEALTLEERSTGQYFAFLRVGLWFLLGGRFSRGQRGDRDLISFGGLNRGLDFGFLAGEFLETKLDEAED